MVIHNIQHQIFDNHKVHQFMKILYWGCGTHCTIMHQVSMNNDCEGKCDHTIVAAMEGPLMYTLSSSHIYCIKLLNEPELRLG